MPEKIIIHQVKQGKIILLNKDAYLQTNKFNNTNNQQKKHKKMSKQTIKITMNQINHNKNRD
jgi:hypothetical protein